MDRRGNWDDGSTKKVSGNVPLYGNAIHDMCMSFQGPSGAAKRARVMSGTGGDQSSIFQGIVNMSRLPGKK